MKTNQPQNSEILLPTAPTFRKVVKALIEKLDSIDAKLSKMFASSQDEAGHTWLNVFELQNYLPSHPKKQTIYSWTSTRKIPFHKKGRSIMFDKAEIDAWLQDSEHVKSTEDIAREAIEFINNKRK